MDGITPLTKTANSIKLTTIHSGPGENNVAGVLFSLDEPSEWSTNTT